MKTIKKISVFLLATSISSFMLSCSKSKDGGGEGAAAEGTITAKVNGTSVTTIKMTSQAGAMHGMLTIQGTAGSTTSKTFSIQVQGFEGVGTYDIGGGSTGLGAAQAQYIEIVVDPANPAAFKESIWGGPYDEGFKAGEIKVAEYEAGNHIKGTFFFEAKNPDDGSKKNITDGSFNLKLK